MERILVSMKGHKVPWEALARSIALCRRIGASLYVLSVLPPGKAKKTSAPEGTKKLEQQLKDAAEHSVHTESFITEGKYEQEVIKFVEQHRITRLVTEHGNANGANEERDLASLQMIRHRVSCCFEIVTPRKRESREDGK